MKLVIAGKGGTGKTTISAALARLAARRGLRTLAIDCDSNPNLGVSLGLDFAAINEAEHLPKTLRRDQTWRADELITGYGIPAPDDVTLVHAARVDQAGAG